MQSSLKSDKNNLLYMQVYEYLWYLAEFFF